MQNPTPITPLESRLRDALSDALDRLESMEPDQQYPDARKVLGEAARRQMQQAGRDPGSTPDPLKAAQNLLYQAGGVVTLMAGNGLVEAAAVDAVHHLLDEAEAAIEQVVDTRLERAVTG